MFSIALFKTAKIRSQILSVHVLNAKENLACAFTGIVFNHKKNEILSFVTNMARIGDHYGKCNKPGTEI
jgi:hypothetical protein